MQTTQNVLNPFGQLKPYFDEMIYRVFKKKLYFYDMQEKKKLPDGTNSHVWTVYNQKEFEIEDVLLSVEGAEPKDINTDARQVTSYVQEYGIKSTITRKASTQTYFDVYTESAIELWRKMAEIQDKIIQQKIDSTLPINGANRIFPWAITARANITSTDVMNAKLVAKAATLLDDKAVPTIGESYVMVIPSKVKYDIITEAVPWSFVDVNKYNPWTVDKIFNGEIGTLYGVRIVVSQNITPYKNAWVGWITVYPSYVMWVQAYGITEGDQLHTIVKPNTAGWAENALNLRGSVGLYMRFGVDILKTESIYIIETAASVNN